MMGTFARTHQAFDMQVEVWVAQALETGAPSFPEFLAQLPGVYPTVAIDALDRMQRSGRVPADLAHRLARQARSYGGRPPTILDPLPPPHPLDFEWRFTKRTAGDLLSLAQTLAKSDDRVVLLGTPAVAAMATAAPIDRVTIFVGDDNTITDAVAALNNLHDRPLLVQTCNPAVQLPVAAGVVLVDPPWYFDFMRPMLTTAASVCRVGGFVLLSLLPIGTRPGAAQDRTRIMRHLQRLSLEIVEVRTGALAYETPFFEANALAAAGLTGISADWRRGDLLVLRKTGHFDTSVVARMTRKRRWHEIAIGRMRLFISRDEPRSGPVLSPLLPGDVLPSVSRRDSRRRKAQVWSSGNRIFASDRPDLVLAAAIQAGSRMPVTTPAQSSNAERDEVKRLSYTLLNLADKEEAEEHGGRVEEAACLSEDSTSNLKASSVTSPTTVFG
jgi:hypothetical protein